MHNDFNALLNKTSYDSGSVHTTHKTFPKPMLHCGFVNSQGTKSNCFRNHNYDSSPNIKLVPSNSWGKGSYNQVSSWTSQPEWRTDSKLFYGSYTFSSRPQALTLSRGRPHVFLLRGLSCRCRWKKKKNERNTSTIVYFLGILMCDAYLIARCPPSLQQAKFTKSFSTHTTRPRSTIAFPYHLQRGVRKSRARLSRVWRTRIRVFSACGVVLSQMSACMFTVYIPNHFPKQILGSGRRVDIPDGFVLTTYIMFSRPLFFPVDSLSWRAVEHESVF